MAVSGSRRMAFGRFDYATFMTFFAYAAGSVVVPVALVTMADDLGFSLESGGMTAGGALSLARTLTMVVSMLLCGFAAGRWGKRRTLGWSVVLMAVGMSLCALSPVYGLVLVALMLAGLGEGVIEGLGTPFVQALHDEEPGRYINFSHGFWSVGVFVTVLAVGALLSFGAPWRVLIGGVAAVAIVPGLLILLPARAGREYPEHPEPIHWRTVSRHGLDIVRTPRFWLYFSAMLFAGGGEFCLTFWCASYIQLHFEGTAWAGGLGTAAFAAGMVVGRTGWGYIIRQRQLKQLILYSALAGGIVTLAFPLLTSLGLFIALLFLAGVATAPFWPSLQSYATDRMPRNDTTMLFVLLSCAGVPGCGFFTWLMGVIGDRTGSLTNAFYLVPLCFFSLAALIAFDWILLRAADPEPEPQSAEAVPD